MLMRNWNANITMKVILQQQTLFSTTNLQMRHIASMYTRWLVGQKVLINLLLQHSLALTVVSASRQIRGLYECTCFYALFKCIKTLPHRWIHRWIHATQMDLCIIASILKLSVRGHLFKMFGRSLQGQCFLTVKGKCHFHCCCSLNLVSRHSVSTQLTDVWKNSRRSVVSETQPINQITYPPPPMFNEALYLYLHDFMQ